MIGSRFEARPILRIRSPVIGRGEQIFELGAAPVTIGRAEECDVVLLEQSASRIHARVVPVEGGWQIVDEGSQGGVWWNGERIAARVLVDGDTIRIGDSEISFTLRPAAQPTVLGSTRPVAAFTPLAPAPPPAVAPPAHASPAVAPPRDAPAVAAGPAHPVVAPPRAPAAPSAPSFYDFGPVGRPPSASAPSFVDFGRVANPGHDRPPSFTGELAADASRMEMRERHSGSRFGTWVLVIFVFLALSIGVAVLAFELTWNDVVRLVGGHVD